MTKKQPRPLTATHLSEVEEGISFHSPEKLSVGLCSSSYCHAQLLIRRCRTEQGSLPRGAELEGSLSAQLATKTHTYQIPTYGVILAAYKIHSNKCVLWNSLSFLGFPETWITEGYHLLHSQKGHLVLKDILQSINLKSPLEVQ